MSAIIEVMIGIVFVFSLLSILVTQINTVISNSLNLRARYLRDGIDDLITDPVLRAKVFAHPLVRMLQQQVLPGQNLTPEEAEKIAAGKLNRVSWIDPKNFVNVLLSIIRADADQELFSVLMNIVDAMPPDSSRRTLRLIISRLQQSGQGLDELRQFIDQMENEVYREALREALDQIDEAIGQIGLDTGGLISIIAGLRKIKNPYFRTALETVLSASKTIEDAQDKLSQWFDDGMTRASEAFARRMMQFSLLVGLGIALLANIDTLQLAKALWDDPALRSAVTAAAQNTDLAAMIQEAEQAQQEALQNATAPEATPEPGAAAEGEGGATIADVQASAAAAQATVQQLLDLRLPIGWELTNLRADDAVPTEAQLTNHRNVWNYFPGNNPDFWWQLVLAKLVGLAATMIAIAQGAPFWFNILNRLMGR